MNDAARRRAILAGPLGLSVADLRGARRPSGARQHPQTPGLPPSVPRLRPWTTTPAASGSRPARPFAPRSLDGDRSRTPAHRPHPGNAVLRLPARSDPDAHDTGRPAILPPTSVLSLLCRSDPADRSRRAAWSCSRTHPPRTRTTCTPVGLGDPGTPPRFPAWMLDLGRPRRPSRRRAGPELAAAAFAAWCHRRCPSLHHAPGATLRPFRSPLRTPVEPLSPWTPVLPSGPV